MGTDSSMAKDENTDPTRRHPEPEGNEDERRRRDRLAEVQRRLEAGELDSELALVETALALLDGDLPQVQ